jgi:hypothetical protein
MGHQQQFVWFRANQNENTRNTNYRLAHEVKGEKMDVWPHS